MLLADIGKTVSVELRNLPFEAIAQIVINVDLGTLVRLAEAVNHGNERPGGEGDVDRAFRNNVLRAIANFVESTAREKKFLRVGTREKFWNAVRFGLDRKWYVGEETGEVCAWAFVGTPDEVEAALRRVEREGRVLFSTTFSKTCITASYHGRLDVIQRLFACYDVKGCHQIETDVFAMAMANGHLHVLKWMFAERGVRTYAERNIHAYLGAYFGAMGNGHTDALCWFSSSFGTMVDKISMKKHGDDIARACKRVASGGHYNTLLWLRANFDLTTHKHAGRSMADNMFHVAVYGGHLDIMAWFDRNFDVTLSRMEIGNVLYSLAEDGKLDVLHWVHKRFTKHVNSAVAYSDAFQVADAAAEGGHLDVLKWLYVTPSEKSDPARFGDAPFYEAAANGHVHILKWLHTNVERCFSPSALNTTSGRSLLRDAFVAAAIKGHFDVLKWLHATYGGKNCVNHCEEPCKVVSAAAENGNLRVLVWLQAKFEALYNPSSFVSSALVSASARGDLVALRWFHARYSADFDSDLSMFKKMLEGAISGGHPHVIRWLHAKHPRAAGSIAGDTFFDFVALLKHASHSSVLDAMCAMCGDRLRFFVANRSSTIALEKFAEPSTQEWLRALREGSEPVKK